jgi:hypothetical protein
VKLVGGISPEETLATVPRENQPRRDTGHGATGISAQKKLIARLAGGISAQKSLWPYCQGPRRVCDQSGRGNVRREGTGARQAGGMSAKRRLEPGRQGEYQPRGDWSQAGMGNISPDEKYQPRGVCCQEEYQHRKDGPRTGSRRREVSRLRWETFLSCLVKSS